MRAIVQSTLGGPSELELRALADPVPGADELVIDVHAAGVTFIELLQSKGEHQGKPELPFVPGPEVAGVVRSAPVGSAFEVGDRVVAYTGRGGYAEAVAVPERMVFPLPGHLSFVEGAALPMNLLTSYFALTTRGHLLAGETVLVHGAAGGIGMASVQLARALGARVIAVVSTEQKADVARSVGAHDTVLAEGFLDSIRSLTNGRGVDVVVDPVGGERFTDSLRSLAPDGRVLVIGFTSGDIPLVKVNRLLMANTSVVGVGWGAYFRDRPELPAKLWGELLPHLEAGLLDPVVGPTFALADAGLALQAIDERSARGKVVLAVR